MEVVTNLWKGEETAKQGSLDDPNGDSAGTLSEVSMYSAAAAKGKRKSSSGIGLNWSNTGSNPNDAVGSDTHRGNSFYSQKKSAGNLDKPSSSSSIQQMMTDTLVEKIIKMALPPSSLAMKEQIASRMASAKNRPSLSVPLLSRNFILMNSRLGLPFMVIDNVISFINWENVPMTLSVMCGYTLAVLYPLITIACGPICYILFQVMVPHYMHVHLPNPISQEGNHIVPIEVNRTPAQGPPLREPILPEAVPEFSQEFVINLQDLQNHVLLYVAVYDFVYFIMKRFVFFINEQISTAWFIILLTTAVLNYLFIDLIWPLIPIKFLLVVMGWSLIILLHPRNRDNFMQKLLSEETRLTWLQFTNKYEHKINEQLRFVEARENRIVDIFEIQVYKSEHKEWTTVGYHFDDYTKFSPQRLQSNDKVFESQCVKSLDEIQPPAGWEWVPNNLWELNLSPEKWVRERFLTHVKVDSSTKWVYDKIEDHNKSNNKKTSGKMYRRRMWIRHVIRQLKIGSKGSVANTNNDDTNDLEGDTIKGRNIEMEKVQNSGIKNKVNGSNTSSAGIIENYDTSHEEIEEVVNPLREDHHGMGYSNIRGIARRSMSGASATPLTPVTSGSMTDDHNIHGIPESVDEEELTDANVLMDDVTNIINTSI